MQAQCLEVEAGDEMQLDALRAGSQPVPPLGVA